MAGKSEAIEQEFRRKIHAGEWPAAMRIKSELELCEEFNVSRTTIRAALNALRSERLLISRPKIGTLVSSIAGRKSIVILARQEDIMAPFGYFMRDLVSHASEIVRENQYNTMLVMGFGETASEVVETLDTHYGSALRAAAGIISVATLTEEMEQYLNQPIMPPWTGVQMRGMIPFTVYSDYSQLHRQAAEVFRRRGIDRFATVYTSFEGLPEEDQNCWLDELVGRLVARDHAFARQDYLVKVPYDLRYEQARTALLEWWRRPTRPRALFFTDDALFDAVSHTLVGLNPRIPDDLAILTLANVGRQFFFPVKPDRIGQCPKATAGKLFELLTMRMERPERDDVVWLSEWKYRPGQTLPSSGLEGRRRGAGAARREEAVTAI